MMPNYLEIQQVQTSCSTQDKQLISRKQHVNNLSEFHSIQSSMSSQLKAIAINLSK